MQSVFLKKYKNCKYILTVLLVLLLLNPLAVSARDEDDDFPVYPEIISNIKFWEAVYSEYSLNQGLLHDSDDLDKIYGVVDLVSSEKKGARKLNRQRIKVARRHFKNILLRFARGGSPETLEEQRLFDMFGPEPARQDFYRAARNIRFQLGQKDRFRRGVIRSGAYLDQIKEIFRSYGLADDLAYLAHVESSYNYKAYSKFGAAGIWQFTRSTGRRFMKVDYTLDERRDPIRATYAAAKLLKKNYEKLGSWPLAITAYNHGAAGMLRAKERYGDYETIFEKYKGAAFKFASRNFYSEFLAACKIAKNHEKYFGALDMEEPVPTCEVKIQGFAAIHDLADYFQVDVDVLRELNPALREPIFLGQKFVPRGCTLRLPADSGAMDDKTVAHIPDELYKSGQKHSYFYMVRRGDTLGRIARINKVSVRDLVLANQLDSRATIYVGQNLRIPGSREEVVLLTASKKKPTANNKILLAGLKQAPAEQLQADMAENDFDDQKVDKASEVTEIEKTSDQSSAGYMQASIVPFSFIGDKVMAEIFSAWQPKIHERAPQAPRPPRADFLAGINPAVVSGKLNVARVFQSHGREIGVITVEAEETLGHYAEWLEVPAQEIRRVNGFRYGRAIRVSQLINIPLDNVSREKFEERRYEYHKEMEEDFWDAYRVVGINSYSIRKGENIWTLCSSEFDLPFWLIKKYNEGIDFSRLMPTQPLIVPVVERVG